MWEHAKRYDVTPGRYYSFYYIDHEQSSFPGREDGDDDTPVAAGLIFVRPYSEAITALVPEICVFEVRLPLEL